MSAETDHILHVFNLMLAGPTGDGKAKRDAGLKVHWAVDDTHFGAAVRHYERWNEGEQADPDSGCHPLVHMAWRLLAVAYQELAERGEAPAPAHPDPELAGQRQFWEDVKNQPSTSIGARAEGEEFVEPRHLNPHHPDFRFDVV